VLHIPDDLATRITAQGGDLEVVALEALRHAAEDMERRQRSGRRTLAKAAARMRQSRTGNPLPDGMTIRADDPRARVSAFALDNSMVMRWCFDRAASP
jgi:hypothetical protein